MSDMAQDRRLIVRVLRTWNRIAEAGFPRRAQIDPAAFGADWAQCAMIDIDRPLERSRFSYVGNALRDPRCTIFDRQCVSDCLEDSLLELVARHLPKAVDKGEPVSCAGAASHEDLDILYRAIILPLSEDGRHVDGVLAAIGYREAPAATVTSGASVEEPTHPTYFGPF